MSDDDLAMKAAEYALGTLAASERAEFARRIAGDPAAQALVREWELRLAPMASVVPQIAPDPALLGRIEAELDARAEGANVVALRRSVVRWRIASGVTGALAAALALFAVVRAPVGETVVPRTQQVAQVEPKAPAAAPQVPAAVPANAARGSGGVTLAGAEKEDRGGLAAGARTNSLVATLAPVGERAGLAAELDSDGRLSVRRLAVDIPAGKDLALWLLAPGRAPRAIGVLSRDAQRFSIGTDQPESGDEIAATFEPKDTAPARPTAPYAYRGRLVRQ